MSRLILRIVLPVLLASLVSFSAHAVFIDSLEIKETPNADPALNEAATAFARGDVAGAKQGFMAVLENTPGSVGALLGLADVAWYEGDRDATQNYLQRAMVAAPDNAAVQTGMGRFLYLSKDIPAAITHFERAVELDPALVDPLIELGSIYATAAEGQDRSRDYYAKAIELAPARMDLRYAHAVVLASGGAVDKAADELTFAGEFLKTDPYPYQLLGTVYAEAGRVDEAIAAFDEALRRDASLGPALWARSELQLRGNQLDKAQAGFERLIAIQPENAPAHARLALIIHLGGDFSAAEPHYLEAIRLDPDNALAFNNLAYGASEQGGRSAQALEWAQRAVELQPANPEFRETLAMAHQNAGDLETAESILTSIVAEYPEFAPAAERLAAVKAAMGKS